MWPNSGTPKKILYTRRRPAPKAMPKPGDQGPASKIDKTHPRATYTCSIYDCSFLHKPCYEEVPIAGSVCMEHLEQASAIINHHAKALQRHREEQSNGLKSPEEAPATGFQWSDMKIQCPKYALKEGSTEWSG